MRPSQVVAILVVVAAAAGLGFRQYQSIRRSPFAFGPIRPGRDFESIDDESARFGVGRMYCDTIPAAFRVCRVGTDGPPGNAYAVVDEKGRVLIWDQQISDSSSKTQDLTRTLVATWDSLAGSAKTTDASGHAALRWTSNDASWSAAMVLAPGGRAATEITLTDEASLSAMDAARLPALVVLARRGFVPEALLDGVESRAPGALVRAADSVAAPARLLAASAARLPECPAEPVIATEPGTSALDALGVQAAVAQQAVARAFPGKRLLLAGAAYLVDAAGAAERVEITPSLAEDGALHIFAITFSDRVGTVSSGARAFDAPPCRAPAQLLAARVDTATGALLAAQHAEVEGEALASRVQGARVSFDGGSTLAVTVRYTATYGAPDWHGAVDWDATFALDSLRLLRRRPLTLAKTDRARRVSVVTLPEDEASEDESAEDSERTPEPPLAGRRVTAIEPSGGQHAESRTVQLVLPSAVQGQPLGWLLLTVL